MFKEKMKQTKKELEKRILVLERQVLAMESYTLDLLNTTVDLVENNNLPFPFHNYCDIRKNREKMFRVLARKVSKAPKFIVLREGFDF